MTEKYVRLACLITLLTVLCAVGGAASTVTLATGDIAVRVDARDGRLALTSLRCNKTGRDWIASDQAITAIPLVASAEIEGRTVPLRWHLTGCRSENATIRRSIFTFACRQPRLEMRSEWQAHPGSGPIEHSLSITNRSGQALLLPLQTSLIVDARAPVGHTLECWWAEKGGGAPTEIGTHREIVMPGFTRTLLSTPYAEDNRPRDAIPWAAVQDREGNEGWYAGIEFSGRVRQDFKALPADGHQGVGVRADLGLSPDEDGQHPYRTRLTAGETFRAPTVFVGCYAGNVDDGANGLHRWVGRILRPPIRDPRYPLLVLNSWGSGMAVDAGLASRMIDDGAALGLEMFHIDAGWFRGVGDWRPDPAKFPEGLAAVADHAHAKGLKFGLWVGWTQGGIHPDAEDRQGILNVFAPDRKNWFAHDYAHAWKPADFVGADLCLADTRAGDWCLSLLDRLVKEYRLDMLEHDQRMIVDACERGEHSHTGSHTDIAYRAALGYYRVYDALRTRYPHLLFEDCVNGGRTVDYGIVRRVHYISITDTYSPLANRRAFYDASYPLPPAMCECYLENTPVKSAAEFRTMLRSGMMGWCTVMCDTNRWTPEQHAIAMRQFQLYKTVLRPLINTGNLYHISERPDGVRWDGMEYADRDGKRAVVLAFRGTTGETSHVFYPRGLDAREQYRVSFEDGNIPPIVRSGSDIMQHGIRIGLGEPMGSQIVRLDRQAKTVTGGQRVETPR